MIEWLSKLWEKFVGGSAEVESNSADTSLGADEEFVRMPDELGYGLFTGESGLFREFPERNVDDVVADWLEETDGGSLRR